MLEDFRRPFFLRRGINVDDPPIGRARHPTPNRLVYVHVPKRISHHDKNVCLCQQVFEGRIEGGPGALGRNLFPPPNAKLRVHPSIGGDFHARSKFVDADAWNTPNRIDRFRESPVHRAVQLQQAHLVVGEAPARSRIPIVRSGGERNAVLSRRLSPRVCRSSESRFPR